MVPGGYDLWSIITSDVMGHFGSELRRTFNDFCLIREINGVQFLEIQEILFSFYTGFSKVAGIYKKWLRRRVKDNDLLEF